MAKTVKVGKGTGKEFTEDEVFAKCESMIQKYGTSGALGQSMTQAMFFARYCKKAIEQRRALAMINKNQAETISILSDLNKG